MSCSVGWLDSILVYTLGQEGIRQYTSSKLMQNASLGNREQAGAGIEAPLHADSEYAAPWVAPDRAAGASGWSLSSATGRDRPRR